MTDVQRPAGRSLAQKLDHLFRTRHPSGRRAYRLEEVAEAIRAGGGPTISANYLWLLRKGQRDNPTKHHLEALANFFGVSPACFFDESATTPDDAESRALRDGAVRQLALRASGLSPETLRVLMGLVERLRELEGLPDPGQAPARRRGRPRRRTTPPPPSAMGGGDMERGEEAEPAEGA